MASWNSDILHVTDQLLGWSAFTSWSVVFYPQVILKLRRKSVVGFAFAFAFALLNLTKLFLSFLCNASMYFSSAVQKQYFKKYGYEEMIPVVANVVAFSAHAVLIPSTTMF